MSVDSFVIVPILFALSLLAFAYGMAKRSEGNRKKSKASEISDQARELYEVAYRELEQDLKSVNDSLEKYGVLQLFVKERTFSRVVNFLRSIQQQVSHKSNKKFLSGLEGVSVEKIQEYEIASITAKETVKNFVSSTSTGLAASAGAVGMAQAVGTFTVPHFFGLWTTKIAVADLGFSGAVAWLGHDSIALGTLVLGCVTAGPTLAIEGFRSASRGEKALTQAQEYSTEVNIRVAIIEARRDFLQQVKRRVEELDKLLEDINDRAVLDLREFENISFDTDRDATKFQQLMLFLKALEEIVKTPILDNKGDSINPATESIQEKYREL